jgi:hypothetical protein
MHNRSEWPPGMRQAARLSNGVVVIAEYEAGGRLVRETYISGEEGLLRKVVERQRDRGGASSDASSGETE